MGRSARAAQVGSITGSVAPDRVDYGVTQFMQTAVLCALPPTGPSFYGDEINIEDKRSPGRNEVAGPHVAIAEIRRNGQKPTFAHLHAEHALVPSLDDLARSNYETEGMPAVS